MDRVSLSYNRRAEHKNASMMIIGYEGGVREPKYFGKIEDSIIESRKAFIHPLPLTVKHKSSSGFKAHHFQTATKLLNCTDFSMTT
jgi:hypothetical protein